MSKKRPSSDTFLSKEGLSLFNQLIRYVLYISFYLLDKDIIAETAPHSTPAQAQMIHVKSQRFVKKLTARKIAVTEHQ